MATCSDLGICINPIGREAVPVGGLMTFLAPGLSLDHPGVVELVDGSLGSPGTDVQLLGHLLVGGSRSVWSGEVTQHVEDHCGCQSTDCDDLGFAEIERGVSGWR